MASFVEQAILSLKDNSSPQIKKINAELKKLFATAEKLRSRKINLDIDSKGLTAASANIRRLSADLRGLQNASRAITMRVNPSGLTQAQRQIAALHASARRPILLRTLAAGITGGVAAHAAARQIKEGTRTLDVGETSLALKEIPQGMRRNYVDDAIRKISEEQSKRVGGGMWNRGHIMQQYSEMAGVVKLGAARDEADFRQRADAAQYLADQNLELAATFVKLGMDQEQAQATSAKFGKAMEQQGKIFDQSGKLDVSAAAAEYNNIRKLIPAIGKEATGENYLALMKYLRVSKFSLEPEAIASAMFKFEEMGTGAAVGINQLIKNLQGSAKPAALAEQYRLGLISGKEVTTGRVGRQRTKILTGEMSEADSDLLRRSPQTYVNERLIPRLRDDLKRQGKTDAQIETMLNDAQKSGYVARQTQKIASDRTAQEMLASMILLRNENAEALRDFRSRSGTLESQRAATRLSVIGATAAVSSQLQGAFGEAVRAAAPLLVPALGSLSKGLSDIADVTHRAAQGDKEAQRQVESGALSAAAIAPVALAAKSLIGQAIAAVSAPVGIATGMAGAMDPGASATAKSLAYAGISLNAAAVGLQHAGAAQLEAAGKGGLIGQLMPWLLRAGVIATGAAAGPAGPGSPGYEYGNLSEEARKLARELTKPQAALANLDKERTLAEQKLNSARIEEAKHPDRVGTIKAAEERLAAVEAQIATAKQQEATIAEKLAVASGQKDPRWPAFWKMFEAPTSPIWQPREGWPEVPLPRPRPAEATPWSAQAIKALDFFKPKGPLEFNVGGGQPININGMTTITPEGAVKPITHGMAPGKLALEDSGASITAAATQLATVTSTLPAELLSASSTFAQTFSTASIQLGAAGQSAADIILAGASGAGSVYGNTAAAIIAAAAASATINVNTNVRETGRPDTGALKPG